MNIKKNSNQYGNAFMSTEMPIDMVLSGPMCAFHYHYHGSFYAKQCIIILDI